MIEIVSNLNKENLTNQELREVLQNLFEKLLQQGKLNWAQESEESEESVENEEKYEQILELKEAINNPNSKHLFFTLS